MMLATYLPLSLPIGLAAVLTWSSAPGEAPATQGSPTATGIPTSPAISAVTPQREAHLDRGRWLRATVRELDTEQRWRLIAELARLRADERPVALELVRSFGEHLDVGAVLEAIASGRGDRLISLEAASPFVEAGLGWLDEIVGLRPDQTTRLRREWRHLAAESGLGSQLGFGARFAPLGSDAPFDRETRAAWRSFVRALAGEAAAQQGEAQPLRQAVLNDALAWGAQILAVLSDEQEQAILDAVRELAMLPREERQAQLCALFSGVDDEALQKAVDGIHAAAPEDRPAAVHAAADVVAAGVLPALSERFTITRGQQLAFELARESFFENTELDRGSLAVLRDERRTAAWSTLTLEEQELLTAAAAELRQRFEDWRDQLCTD